MTPEEIERLRQKLKRQLKLTQPVDPEEVRICNEYMRQKQGA